MSAEIKMKVPIPQQVVTVEKGSILIVDEQKRRWRLPLGIKHTQS